MITRASSKQHPLLLHNPDRPAGFTLLELTVVLFILALVLGALMTPLATRMEYEGRQETEEMLAEMRDSLIGYAVIHGRLPCPDCGNGSDEDCDKAPAEDIGDGDEDTAPVKGKKNSAQCLTDAGLLPWVTLGVPQKDAWGQPFLYAVDKRFAYHRKDGAGQPCDKYVTDGVAFCLESKGNMTIKDASGQTIAQHIPALIFSPGANGAQTPSSAAETENQDGDRTFIADDYIGDHDRQYDDMMIWISTPSLMYRMVNAERLP